MTTWYGILRKSWEIVGYVTTNGGVVCPEHSQDKEQDSPIFAEIVQEFEGYECDTCGKAIK